MEYSTLGDTGLLVSKLCFGTMTFGDGRGLFKALSSVGQAEADELVKTSIDGGINLFATAHLIILAMQMKRRGVEIRLVLEGDTRLRQQLPQPPIFILQRP